MSQDRGVGSSPDWNHIVVFLDNAIHGTNLYPYNGITSINQLHYLLDSVFCPLSALRTINRSLVCNPSLLQVCNGGMYGELGRPDVTLETIRCLRGTLGREKFGLEFPLLIRTERIPNERSKKKKKERKKEMSRYFESFAHYFYYKIK